MSQNLHGGERTSGYGSSFANLLHEILAANPHVQVGADSVDTEPLRRVYEARTYQPIWTGSARAEADARHALDKLREAESEGLRADDYRLARLSAMHLISDQDLAEFDLLMTDSVLRYARDLRSGRVWPVDVDKDIELPALGLDYAGGLASAVANGTLPAFLAELAPKHRAYERLRQALAHYRAIEAAGGWPAVSLDATPEGANADQLRARLAVEDQTAAQDGQKLIDALKSYQERNGLVSDGRLGPRTLAALNIPVATRIEQIRANMERWRWMPRELEQRRITVNVADATLQFVDGGITMLNSNVVVGSLNWRTPILRAEATAVTVNPVWHVPPSIARKEIWPKLRSNPSYLQSQGLVLMDGQIRQPPGPRNALGRIKIEMPNDFGVYLHDTPAKAAFGRESRTLSHGCVRVEQIAPLASLAISGDAESAMGELSQLIAAGKTTRIDLGERLPVYLLYWTAIAGEDGVGFRNDVYGRDALLVSALEGVLDI